MIKALIFGAAGVGLKVKKQLENEGIQVVAFSDNDENKWNKELEGILILPPYDIKIEEYDMFAIGVYRHVETIKKQLEDMGIKEKSITVPIIPKRLFYNDKYNPPYVEKGEKMIMIWGGIESCSESLQNFLKNVLKKRIDFQNNFWAFQYFVEDCLMLEKPEKSTKFWKDYNVTDFLQLCVDIYYMNDIKENRNLEREFTQNAQFIFETDNYIINRMIENHNTEFFWKQRLPRAFEPRFLLRIEKLKEKMMEYNIPLDEVCVVSGSVLEAYGLREAKKIDDLDIIMTDRLRKLYGSGLIIISEEIEMHPQNELLNINDDNIYKISDDEIILNEKYHFWLRGIRFLCLDLLYRHKQSIGNKEELRRINYFLNIKETSKTN